MDFPLVHSDTFIHYHLYSIPNQNQSIIIPPSAYLTLSNNEYQYQDEECRDLQPNFLCKGDRLLPLRDNPDCITSLLSMGNNANNCQQIPVRLTQQIMEEINNAHYIGIFPEPQKLQTECEENDVAVLRGTYLFTVPPKCSIRTSKYTYKNQKGVISGHPITLEEIDDINFPVQQVEKLKLEKISLDKLHTLQLQEIQEEPLQEDNIFLNYNTASLGSVAALTICILAYFTISRRHQILNLFKTKKTETRTTGMTTLNETQVVPPSSSF